MSSRRLLKRIKASRYEVILPWEHDYPTLETELPYRGYPVTLPSPRTWSGDSEESNQAVLELLGPHRTALLGTKRATEGARVVRTSCNFEKIFLTLPCGPSTGTECQNGAPV